MMTMMSNKTMVPNLKAMVGVVFALLLLLANNNDDNSTGILVVRAFSPPLSTTTRKTTTIKSPFLLSASSSSVDEHDEYDFDELLNSNVEKNRLTSMYTRFGHKEWLIHRASDRFYRNLFQIQKSPIVESLLDEVGLLVAISFGIIVWNGLTTEGYTDFAGIYHTPPLADWMPQFKLSLPMEPFLLCGGPLGLLLVFRNDASFGRYNEAFHHWEKIVSNFQNMMLMASTAAPNQRQAIQDMGLACWVLVRTLQYKLSGELDTRDVYTKDILDKLGGKQATELLQSRNKLYKAQYNIHQAIEPLTDHITVLDKRTLINTVNDVALQCVECERLYTTPIPLLYTKHTLKFLTFWMTLMPFGLYDVFEKSWNHMAMIPAMAILTFLFFGIEEIAVSLEEPFSILPLEELVEDVWDSIQDVTTWMDEEQDEQETTNGDGTNTTTNNNKEQQQQPAVVPPSIPK